MSKLEILLVGNYCRSDYLSMLDKSLDYCNFTFLEYISPTEEINKVYLSYGRAVYWSQFQDVSDLLENIKPDKVIFYFIESYNHVILNLACKRSVIPTYHLEHGLRADYILNADIATKNNQTVPKWSDYMQKLFIIKSRLKNRLFLKRSITCFIKEDKKFLQNYFEARAKSSFLETSKSVKSLDRVAQAYISFSPKIFEIHKVVDHLPDSYPVKFIGVPYFDELATVKPTTLQRAILFIDQPLAEHHLLQWTKEYKRHFVHQLTSIAAKYNYKVYVKPHPAQNTSLWQQTKNTVLIDDEKLKEICGSIPVVIGFYSTYLMPLAAMPHTTLITLENHPAGRLDVSKSFIEAGVAHPVYSLDELSWALENIEKLHQEQLPNKKQFEKDWLYKFDGKAGERLRAILLSREL